MKAAQLAIMTGISVSGFGFAALAQEATTPQQVPTGQLKAALAQNTADLPRMVDEVTRLDRIEAGAGEVVYFYTLTEHTYNQFDWPAFTDSILKQSGTNYCTADNMAGFRDANLSMLYIYYDKNGELAGTVKIPNTVCDQLQ